MSILSTEKMLKKHLERSGGAIYPEKRFYGQSSIETIHERRKRNREFVLLIRIGKQNVKIIENKSKLKNVKMNYSRCHRY